MVRNRAEPINVAIWDSEKLQDPLINHPEINPLHDPTAQVGGGHYRDEDIVCPHCRGPLQLWDVLRFTFFNEGAAIKHLFRWRRKNGLQDLLKARQYLDKIIATEFPEHKL
jgi:hypothetical protein